MPEASRVAGSRPAGPHSIAVDCAGCGGPVDPLRAERVGHFSNRFRYFCSAECEARFRSHGSPAQAKSRRRSSRPPPSPHGVGGPFELEGRHEVEFAGSDAAEFDVSNGGVPEGLDTQHRRSVLPVVPEGTDISNLLSGFAALGGCLAIILLLAGKSGPLDTARVLLAVAGFGALAAQYLLRDRDLLEPHPLIALGAPAASVVTASVARLLDHPLTATALNLAGTIIVAQTASIWLIGQVRRKLSAERLRLAECLNVEAQRVTGDQLTPVPALDLRPGEEILLQAGQTLPADITVVAGTGRVRPWLNAQHSVECKKGDTLVAGAELLEGQIRAIVAWAADDRAWLRLTSDPRRRADLRCAISRIGRLIGERGAPIAAALAAVVAFTSTPDLIVIALFSTAAFAAMSNVVALEIAALCVSRSVFLALNNGIAFRSPVAFDRASSVTSAVFCARGTLLLGEPEVANIEAFGAHKPEHVLALLAGAQATFSDPVAHAVLRAARARGIRPNAVRVPTLVPGLGVTAVASGGEPLLVGTRALMLRERISIAFAEARISEMEAMGRSVLLVAQSQHLVGAVGLQDGLRPGARAAVQHLLDVGVEPVLLSADSRDTCEALGRTLDIEHIRPELLPLEASEAIHRLADAGATVAVVGNSPVDDACLSAAQVSIALGSAGSGTAEWSVQLASDDVRDAALAVRIAHRSRALARIAIITSYAPAMLVAVASGLGLVSLVLAPLVGLVAVSVAVLRFRTTNLE